MRPAAHQIGHDAQQGARHDQRPDLHREFDSNRTGSGAGRGDLSHEHGSSIGGFQAAPVSSVASFNPSFGNGASAGNGPSVGGGSPYGNGPSFGGAGSGAPNLAAASSAPTAVANAVATVAPVNATPFDPKSSAHVFQPLSHSVQQAAVVNTPGQQSDGTARGASSGASPGLGSAQSASHDSSGFFGGVFGSSTPRADLVLQS